MRTIYFFQETALSCLLLLVALSAQAQFTQLQKITPQAAQRQAGAIFGRRVATDADVMVVAAPDEPGGGAAYVFEKSGGAWIQTARLVSSSQATDGSFGFSVGVSGGTIVVGAYVKDDDANGGNPLTQAGAAYVFEKSGSTWSQTQKLLPNVRAAGDFFGFSVGVSGGTIVVGSTGESQDASEGNTVSKAGAVYVFGKSGSIWAQTQKIVASIRGTSDQFGFSLGISGNTLVAGSPSEDEDLNEQNTLSAAGSAYVFEKSGSTWIQTQKIIANDRAAGDVFGYSASISGNSLVVGAVQEDEDVNGGNTFSNAGSAYVFEKSGSTWSQTQKLVPGVRAALDLFAWSVSVSGNTIVVGAPSESEDASEANTLGAAGSAYVFEKSGSTWSQTQKLVASDRAAADQFGYSVGISGGTLVVGAVYEDEDASGGNPLSDAGSAYIFAASCTKPTFGITATSLAGTSVCTSETDPCTLSVSLCAGGNFSFSAYTDNGPVGFLEKITGGSANVLYAGSPVPVPRDQTNISASSAAGYFAGTYGPYTLASGSSGTLTQTYTPYTDANNDGDYDEGIDCLGTPITLTYTITALEYVGSPVVAAATTCAGQSLGLSFNANACLSAGNTFTAYLSDASGSFASPVSLGSVTPGMSNLLTIPAGTLSGAGYKIQVISTNAPALTSAASNAFSVTGLSAHFNSTPTVSLAPACAGATIRVSFTQSVAPACPFPLGNVFSAELSDATGSFAVPVTLGVVTPGINSLTVPQNTPSGSGYRVRIAATTNGSSAYSTASAAFSINQPAFSSTPTVSIDNKCAGEAVRLSFTVGGCAFPSGNSFTAQLSNATGSFANPVNVGTVTPGAITNVTIPTGTPAGTGYKLRVVSSNPAGVSAVSGNFKVKVCGNTREAAPESSGLQVVVRPNPSPEGRVRITVSGAEGQVLRVELFNGAGQSVRETSLPKAGEEEILDWDISRQPQGLYLLRVSSGRESKTMKVLH